MTEAQQMWDMLENLSQEYLLHGLNENKLELHYPADKPIGISFASDQHIGNSGTDHRRARKDAETVRDTEGLFVALAGDSIDNFIKHQSAIINAKSSPSDQLKAFSYYINILKEKLLFAISGNHEYWTKGLAGIDVLKWLFEEHKIKYSPHDYYVNVHVGEQLYRIYMRHSTRFNSSINAMHGIKRTWDMGDYDFDIGICGHTHTAGTETFYRHQKKRLAINPGSYKILDVYAEQWGFGRARPTSPVVILYPDRWEMNCFDDLETGARILTSERS